MATKNKTAITAPAPATVPTKWLAPIPPGTADLELQGRTVDLHVTGHQHTEVSLDPLELGIREINLALPGIKIRISL